jgi:hypothetical protein
LAGGHEVVVYEKMLLVEEQDNEKKMVLHLTWGQVGTGCQMFSIDSLLTLVKDN